MFKRNLIAALAVVGGIAMASGASATTVTIGGNSGTVTVTQVGPQNPGTFDNNALGDTSGYSSAMYNGALGQIYFSTGNDTLGVFQSSDSSNAAAPDGDASHYIYGVGQPTTVSFLTEQPVHSFLIYWGSIDASKDPAYRYDNILTLSNGDKITGSDLLGLFTPPVDGMGTRDGSADNKWFLITDSNGFSSFTATSNSQHAFEFDMAVPEPSVWMMLILGFGLIGFTLRTSRKADALVA